MNPWIEITGWTLIHFVWQGTLLTLATAAALRLCRRSAAQVRYVAACLGLTAMLVTAAVTAFAGAFPAAALTGAAGRATPPDPREPAGEAVALAGPLPLSAGDAVRRAADVTRLLPIVVWVWLAGVALLMARLTGGCWRVHRLRVATLAAPFSSWQPAAERLARRMRVAMPFRVVESGLVEAPILIGWLQPLVVLPLAAMANMTAAQVEALLAHELAHVRRRDYAINLLQTIAEALLFFHPGVWWVSRRIRQEREHCCDDAAIAVAGEATAYAEALMTLAAWREREFQPSLGAAKSSLLPRIRRVLSLAPDGERPGSGGLLVLGTGAALAATTLLLFAASSATAQPPGSASAENRRVRQTDHFEIYYPPSLDLHADRMADEAERAYARVSVDLRHNLAFKVPLILFESAADLQRSSESGAADAPRSAADREDRILFHVDVPADQWLGLVTHEVAHVFGFDILPGSATPAWISEGLAEYERSSWDPDDLVLLRRAVRTNAVPRMSTFRSEGAEKRFVEALGHAVFDFIESRWGKAGVRQFLLALRRSAGGGGDPYETAFNLPAGEFDRSFETYLRTRLGDGAEPEPRALDAMPTVQVEGVITAIGVPAASQLACIELLVPGASEVDELWGIECGEARAEEVIRTLEPGQRVVVTGLPAIRRSAHRLVIRSLVRRSDGFVWRLPA